MDNEYNVYEDINTRTGGELYLGIVGPVRTGKSTFIKNFMELMVIPEMQDEAEKMRTRDELRRKNNHDDRAKIYSERGRADSDAKRRKRKSAFDRLCGVCCKRCCRLS